MQYIISKIKKLLSIYSNLFKQISLELAECHLESQKNWPNPHEKLSDFIALLFYWTFLITVLLIIILPIVLFLPIIIILLSCVKDWLNSLIDWVKKWLNSPFKSIQLPMLQLSENDIYSIIYKILQKNEVELELMPLNTIENIFPPKYSPSNNINGFDYVRLIARYKPDAELDYITARELVNTKILQYLQMYYPNSNYIVNGLGIITVFNIEKDAMHPNHYAFHVMYVDTQEKAEYITNLWNNEKIQQMNLEEFNLFDEDF